MTDLISGRETLDEVNFIVFCGGFSNSDVLGSAKGWAGGFLFNPKAKAALDRFYQYRDRRDCQIRLLQERVKNLMKQNLMSRSFGQMILYELKQIH